MMGGNTYFACSLPLSVVPYTYSRELFVTLCDVVHVPSADLPKCFCSVSELPVGFVMFLPCREKPIKAKNI